ncbi:unnamed protein product, partial [Owenia fusiformis]
FYQCNHGSPVPRTCNWPLHFQPLTGNCDWPRNVNCQSTETPDTTKPPQRSTVTTQITTTTKPTTTDTDVAFKCPTQFGHYAHPTLCSHFYQCNHGSPVPRTCNWPLHFQPLTGNCDWP